MERGVRTYAPEYWGSLEKFSRFYSGTYSFSPLGQRSVSGAINHFRKGLTLRDLAIKLIPNLEIDESELKQHGFTHAINSRELSAVVEGVIMEIYSSLDCTRKIITEIYSKYRGVPANSTRKFFAKIKNDKDKVDERFPQQLIFAVDEAVWYEELRRIRDELTHLDTGSCHKDKETGKVMYMHTGLGFDEKSLIIDDIMQKMEQIIDDVNQFTGRVFAYLLTQLKDEPMIQVCGFFNARVYTRYVSPSEAVDFHGGVCDAKRWFELEENPTCVYANECGAYKNSNKPIGAG
jgi:hypothetical protein